MVQPRTWAHCDTCRKLRSSIVDGTCLSCRDALERGLIVPRSATSPPPEYAMAEPPAPERYHADAALGREPGTTARMEQECTTECDLCDDFEQAVCVCGRDDLDRSFVVDITPLDDDEQHPVKRRWWKRRR